MIIRVVNLHEDEAKGLDGKYEYIGRPNVLGNPWAMGVERQGRREVWISRETVIERHRQWLWLIVQTGLKGGYAFGECERWLEAEGGLTTLAKDCLPLGRPWNTDDLRLQALVWFELLRLLDVARAGQALNLQCFCKPRACHGDTVKGCLEWLAARLAPRVQTPVSRWAGPLSGTEVGGQKQAALAI